MTAWEILTGNSTAPLGSTAWVHLNNQQGGGLGDGYILVDSYNVELDMTLSAEIEPAEYAVEVEAPIAVTIETNVIDVEID